MAEFSVADRKYMVRAIQLAKRGQYTTHPNPNVGCVLVRDGQVLAEGWTQPAGEAHAEVHALQQINHQAAGATAYVTLEPCSHYGHTPPCSDALIKSRVKRVVAAMVDPNPLVSGRGLDKLRQAGVETQHGLLESQVRQLMPGFISAMQRQQSFVGVQLRLSGPLRRINTLQEGLRSRLPVFTNRRLPLSARPFYDCCHGLISCFGDIFSV